MRGLAFRETESEVQTWGHCHHYGIYSHETDGKRSMKSREGRGRNGALGTQHYLMDGTKEGWEGGEKEEKQCFVACGLQVRRVSKES